MGKKRWKKGESLIETVAALLITSLALTLLPGAIVAAARVNNRMKQVDYYNETAENAEKDSGSFELEIHRVGADGGEAVAPVPVERYSYKAGNRTYYYYTKKE